MSHAIIVKNISKSYRLYKDPKDRIKESLSFSGKSYHQNFLANDNISFNIKKGEVVGIIGKNGSGKSTLLKMITGVLTPSSGSIQIDSKITALLELGAGFNPEMTGLENLYLSGSISGFSEKEMEEKLDTIIKFAEIGEFIHQPLKTYSSGMRARLGFAFAINVDPEVLIVDEALSVGDAAFQRKCYAKIEEMCKSQEITVLFISHSGSVIKQLCNRAILLHAGKLILDGDPKKVVNLYEKFVGSKALNANALQKEYINLLQNDKKNDKKIISHSFYNPNIIPKSTIEHMQNGAILSNVKLFNINNNLVNVLEKNETYIFTYQVHYKKNFENVRVNMRIHTTTGIVITGEALFLPKVAKNKTHTIKFEFKNILNEGEYFFSIATNSMTYGELITLHRIVDAYMIKVNVHENDGSRGLVSINAKGTVIEDERTVINSMLAPKF